MKEEISVGSIIEKTKLEKRLIKLEAFKDCMMILFIVIGIILLIALGYFLGGN